MAELDLTDCDREQIHIPGAVQPHGALLVLDRTSHVAHLAGGACESCLGTAAAGAIGRSVADLLGPGADGLSLDACDDRPDHIGSFTGADGQAWDGVAHLMGDRLVLEAEPAPAKRMPAGHLARSVEAAAARFAQAGSLAELCDIAATAFRAATGFDRVMVYRFLPDDSGSVVAEAKAAALPTFLNHRYPASDIPRQARALYERNVIRVIPDAGYTPSDLVGADPDAAPLDMSHCHLRSVSPIHLQYLRNMGVTASASISILREGRLWGLVACHHGTPRRLSCDDRTLCRLMAADLSLRIVGFENADLLNGRLRSRALEDELLARLGREGPVAHAIAAHAGALLRIVPAHGVAIRRQDRFHLAGRCPDREQVRALGDWLLSREAGNAFATARLYALYAPAAEYRALASGVMAVTVSHAEPLQLIWFRAEQIETVSWAGNPHKPAAAGPSGQLTPRKSFDLWQETVRGRSEPWTMVEVEATERLARAIRDLQRSENVDRLNLSLKQALSDRDSLLEQQRVLLREGDHRIQNSLQILSATLSRQMRIAADPQVRVQLEEALSRIHAVSAVHRRLFRADQPHIVQFDTYLQELLADIGASVGEGWAGEFRIRTSPVLAPTEMALSIGLVVTELVLNAVKYAYEDGVGPIEVELEERRNRLLLSVRDWGRGQTTEQPGGHGFGSRLLTGLLERLHGEIRRTDARPGIRVIVEAPLRFLEPGNGTRAP
ncbi:MAG: GAF domain-containing protein [Sneathiellaceae bacterium]